MMKRGRKQERRRLRRRDRGGLEARLVVVLPRLPCLRLLSSLLAAAAVSGP